MKKSLAAAMAIFMVASAGAASAQSRGPDHHNTGRGPAAAHERAPERQDAQRWKKGQRLPASYRDNSHRVDHSRYGLRAPPRGYAYYRSGNDIVLTAVATGLISSVLNGAYR
ncbi:MAG: RcnB family protein [Brevundimonas sp.]|uniref:RcnB family protein n=1 Tax=Brevundimonas sp. TaxID=1871086 RepID=UPI00271F75AF|nr:RcnB family protein [Brevundimonas sp.]MDO9610062.1 RcnB family protein [Brevundimonas sp.]